LGVIAENRTARALAGWNDLICQLAYLHAIRSRVKLAGIGVAPSSMDQIFEVAARDIRFPELFRMERDVIANFVEALAKNPDAALPTR
jgi:hypothetical protein